MAHFDTEVDVIVAGSGAGGMTAALAARSAGLDTLLVEKSSVYGGTTAMSGAGIWVPNAPSIVRAGGGDDPEEVLTYLETITEGRVSRTRLRRYIDEGPKMLAFVERLCPGLQLDWKPGYPDYYPNAAGGSAVGRSVSPAPMDLRQLGDDLEHLRPPGAIGLPMGMWITANELEHFYAIKRSWRGKLMFLRLVGRVIRVKLTGERISAGGQALIAQLRMALRRLEVPVWLHAPIGELIVDDDGRIVGAEVVRAGQPLRVRARGGVILATGGFDRNLTMRTENEPMITEDWSMGSADLAGDGIRSGVALGAATDLMDDAWWMPGIRRADGSMGMLLAERMIPNQFVVNGAGERFVNEAAPYADFCNALIAGQRTGVSHIPAWLIIDDRAWRDYIVCGHLPIPKLPAPVPTGRKLPQAWIDAEIVKTARTLPALAHEIGVPAEALMATAARFNGFARQARDEDFHRGESVYDNYYGDPRLPNPNLKEIDSPPYYAFRLFPGDLGTKGGLVTNEDGRVLREDGEAIAGLYATGNTSAAVMGRSYAGPGATIGPAMTFGYLAAQHIAARLSEERAAPEPAEPARTAPAT